MMYIYKQRNVILNNSAEKDRMKIKKIHSKVDWDVLLISISVGWATARMTLNEAGWCIPFTVHNDLLIKCVDATPSLDGVKMC